ncbi:MAG TPA: hypothetical protein PLM45_06540 [Caldisericia bacterium]|nr:hypothetical protein [Caldisericia bacterium]HQJ44772.1 hypothetical protein [Caldisericia bacterium]
MFCFVISSWQRFLGATFNSPVDTMKGSLVLLCKLSDSNLSEGTGQLLQEADLASKKTNPYKTTVTGKIEKSVLLDELFIATIDCGFPVNAVIKLPCGKPVTPYSNGDTIEVRGEFQFHPNRELPDFEATEVMLKNCSLVLDTEVWDEIWSCEGVALLPESDNTMAKATGRGQQ